MAHEVDMTTGEAGVFVVGTPAWHKLGKVISAAATSAEAIKLAVLDWIVEQKAMFLDNGKKVPGRVANVRSDTGAVLGVVSPGYNVFQNADSFDFMDSLVSDKLAMFETAGSLKGGKIVWMLARIPKELRAAGQDVVNPYVLLTNGHDGTRALRMIPTSVRVVCNNTLNLAMGRSTKGGGFTLHHSKNLQARVEDARSKLGIIVERVDTFQEEIQALARHSLKETEVTDYFHKLFPVKSKKPAAIDTGRILDQILDATAAKRDLVDELLAGNVAEQSRAEKRNEAILEQIMVNFHNSTNTMPGVEGSAWAAYNAVSEWADHQKAVRGKSEWDKADNRLNSIWFGSANQVKQEAYQNALALVR